jgi:glutathione S-transferase
MPAQHADNYVMTPMQKIVLDRLRPEPERDAYGVGIDRVEVAACLLARASVARAVDEGRPYRSYFPLGAPDRD